MTHVPIDDLTFGIELEVIMPTGRSRDELATHFLAGTLSARHEQYNHDNRPWWKITTDASIGYNNAEVVSPVLSGETGFGQLRLACALLDSFGCRVNRACGFHVHVGVRDRFAQQIGFFKELLRTYAKFEPVIDALMAPSRRATNNQYCGPTEFGPRIESATSLDALMRFYGGNRFKKVNLLAYGAHGTVEFRQHQGTTNGQKVENWVRFCLRLVQHSAKNTEASQVVRARPPLAIPGRPDLSARDYGAAQRVNGDDIPRFIRAEYQRLRDLIITYVTPRTPRRPGTAGRENHERHNIIAADDVNLGRPMDLWTYHCRGGRRTHLAWDVDHGYVHVVDRRTAPVAPSAATEHAVNQPLPAAPEPPTYERPNTDLAPVSLEGLLELIGASDAERAFFTERQMELNP